LRCALEGVVVEPLVKEMSPVKRGDSGIPRLQELTFLQKALEAVVGGGTFEDVRTRLIDHMASRRQGDFELDAAEFRRLARSDLARYASNATEALAELMRLGMVERVSLPSTRKALIAYRGRRFTATSKGVEWHDLLAASITTAYDDLLKVLWRQHSQFAGYLLLLSRGALVVPTANWSDVHPALTGVEGRGPYVVFLAKRVAQAVATATTGWSATQEEIEAAIREYLDARLKAAELRHASSPYPRNRDFVGACEEALVSFAFRRAGIPLDYISHEILRRWTKDLGVANFSYHVPDLPALRLWATADIAVVDGLPDIKRRVGPELIEMAIGEIPAAYDQARRMERDTSWVPIYRVRACLCARLRVGDGVFDEAFREFLAQARRGELPYSVNLEISEIGSIPPTERPFRLRDASGRETVYRSMNLTAEAARRIG